MDIIQLGKHISRSLEHELTHLFIQLGDNQLPEEAHTPGHIYSIKNGIDASGMDGDNFVGCLKASVTHPTASPH